MIKRLLRLVGRWARKPVNHTSWVGVVTPTDRPKSVRNSCLIELFCGVVYVVTLSLWHFCWYRGFCHRTGSDLLLFVSTFLYGFEWNLAGILRYKSRSACGDIIHVRNILAELWSLTHWILTHFSLSSQLLLHPCMDLNETWQEFCATSLDKHVEQ